MYSKSVDPIVLKVLSLPRFLSDTTSTMIRNRIFILLFLSVLYIKPLPAAEEYHWKELHKEFDSIAATFESMNPEDKGFERRLNRLETISRRQNNPILRARYRYWNAYFNGNTWNITQNINAKRDYLTETLIIINAIDYDYDYARLLFLTLDIKGEPSGCYLEQYQQINQALDIFQKYKDIKYEAGCYQILGILFSELHEYEKALKYFKKSDSKYEEIYLERSLISNQANEAVVYFYMGQADTAKRTLRRLLRNQTSWSDTNLAMSLYNNLSLMTDSAEERVFCQNKTIEIAQSHSGSKKDYYKALVASNMALQYAQTKELMDSAILLYNYAYKLAKENQSHRIMLHCLSGLSDCYFKKGDYKKAYTNLSHLQALQDSVMGPNKITEINQQEAKKAIDEYQNRLKLQDQKIRLQHRLNWLSLLLILLISCIFIFIIIYMAQKKRMDKLALKTQELQNQKLQQEIDHQNRELASNMLILCEKKRFLQQILMQLEKFREKKDMSAACELALRKKITEHMKSEDEWTSFKIHFESVHPQFFDKLKSKYPELSPNDLKLCAYIKIGLSIKQIAQMTAVLPATVKTNRYLLRKKFHLSEEQSLDSFIFNV